ncbi:MAG: AEC family transporter [Cyanobacteriota bacterium]|nr:AEC family transporter [Cyanobacteriota bacterium]
MARLPLELIPCLVLGVLSGMVLPWLPARLAPILIRWGVPLSLAALLLRSELSLTLVRVGLLGLLVPLACLLLLGLPPLRDGLRHRVLWLGAAVGNTGYWGLPVALALLPPRALATVVAYDLAGTLITWSVGPLLLRGGRRGGGSVLPLVASSPALHGVALFALLAHTPWRPVLAQALWWPARLVLLVALTLMGMRLGLCLKDRTLAFSPGVPWALVFKLLVVPALVWGLAGLLRLPPLDRQALVLQGAAPTALSVLLLAEVEGVEASLASTLVLVSTVSALVTVPLWWRLIH